MTLTPAALAVSPYKRIGQYMKNAPTRYVNPNKNNAMGMTEKKASLYDAFIRLVLDHKMELKKVPQAANFDSAELYAKKLGPQYQAKKYDLNKDGIPDTVIWNRQTNTPAYINGYKLGRSEYAAWNEYYRTHPTQESRIDEPYSEWKTNPATFFNIVQDLDDPFHRTVQPNKDFKKAAREGWYLPHRPQQRITPYAIFSKGIKPFIDHWKLVGLRNALETIPGVKLEQDTGYIDMFTYIVSPITLYRTLYTCMVLRPYFYELQLAGGPSDMASFYAHIKSNPESFNKWFKDNFMANLGNDARPNWALDPDNKVLAKIDSYLNVGKMDIDGSDRHDVIVWLYGLDNWQKKGFLEDVTTGAYDFVSSLKSGDATEKRKYKKKLLTYKQNAQASAREILSKETGWLFADGKAAAIYKTNRDEGRDPNFGTITDSVEDEKHGGDANVPVVSPKDAANANAAAAIDFTKNDDIDGSDIDIDGDDEDEELAPPALDSIIPSSGEITVPELKKKKSKKGKKSKKSKSGQNGTPKITLKNIEDLLGAYETNGDEGLAGWNIGHNQVQQLYDFYTQNQDSVTQDVIDTIVNEYRTE